MKTNLKPVTKAHPCPVCHRDHKCSVGEDGLIMCGRCSGEVAGFVSMEKAKGDEQFSLYRRLDGPALSTNVTSTRVRVGPAPSANGHGNNDDSIDWQARIEEHARRLSAAARTRLAGVLGLPELALGRLRIGCGKDHNGGYISFPEYDGNGKPVGLNRRYENGSKMAMSGGKRGLTIPDGWDNFAESILLDRVLYLVEGASDVLALCSVGLHCVGRPNSTAGVDHLVTLLSKIPKNQRPLLIVVGEHDTKADGQWPGRDGAVATAKALLAKLEAGWVVKWALPPAGCKDLREWVKGQNLPSDCADAWDGAGEKLEKKLAEKYLDPGTATAAAAPLAVIDSATFANTSYPLRWIVRNLLIEGQPAVIGGPKKSLKTSLLIALAVAMGTGRRFLDHFQAEKPTPVGFISGESGPHTIQDVARSVCRAMDVSLADAGVFWGFTLPQLSQQDQLDELAEVIKANKLEVVILDPLYLCLLAGNVSADAANLFDMGPLLLTVARICLDAGATPILAHHAIKRPQNPFEPMELEDLAYSGIAEFARQWILVSRREKYEPGTGHHRLWLNVGGSASFSSLNALDVDEGVMDEAFQGRKWEVTILPAAEAIAAKRNVVEAKRIEKQEAKEKSEDAQLLNALDALAKDGAPVSCTQVRGRAGFSGEKLGRVKERLLAANLIAVTWAKVAIGSGAARAAEMVQRKSAGGCT